MGKTNISVIIPVFNGEKYLGEAIKSVFNQEVKPFEIIVVDDGSTDNSAKIAQQFGHEIKLLKHEKNKGLPATRNLGIKQATGYYLAFLDADDLWLEGKLINQLTFLENNLNIDMVFGNAEQYISPELSGKNRKNLRDELKIMPGFAAGTMLIRNESFLKVGLFDEKLELGEFIDWFSRAKDRGLTYRMLDDIVLKRRIHTTNMGISKRRHLTDYTAILRAALARKRMKK